MDDPRDQDELRARARAGDRSAGCRLAELLAGQGRVEEAIAVLRGLPSGPAVRNSLIRLLLRAGHIEEVRAMAYAGDINARSWLAELFAEQGRFEELGLLAAGRPHTSVARLLARTLARAGRVDEGVAVLRERAERGEPYAFDWLVDLLIENERVEQAVAVLRVRADARDGDAGHRLARLLADHGRTDEAVAVLRRRGQRSPYLLAELLTRQGRVDEAVAVLDTEAAAGHRHAKELLVDLLAAQGRIDDLRARAEAGDSTAGGRYADWLVEHGAIDELRARTDAGDVISSVRLIPLLAGRGRVDDLRELAAAGDTYAGLMALFTELDQAEAALDIVRAGGNDWHIHGRLCDRIVELLAARGRVREALAVAQTRAAEGDEGAGDWVVRLRALTGSGAPQGPARPVPAAAVPPEPRRRPSFRAFRRRVARWRPGTGGHGTP
ncbi:hypothetical protein [Streptomyces chryseus]